MSDVFDSFDRADAGSLGTADTGQSWTSFGGGWHGIVSTKAETLGPSGDAGSHITGGEANAIYKCTFVNLVTVEQFGLIFRYQDDNNFWVYQIFGATHGYLRKRVLGEYTDMAGGPRTFNPGDIFEVEANNDLLTVKQNNATIHTLTDTFNQGASAGGILARPGAQYDDFYITAIGGSPPPPPPPGGGGAKRKYRRTNLLLEE